ncbi:MAG: glycosyl hydrolase [Ruminococcaceae bacterium]|nr:glycosyl hydrolase [Oscillospiraceae bacterium]
MKNKELLDKLTLEEKVGLCSGKDFWTLKGIPRIGIPEITLTDGPHGLRKKNNESGKSSLSDSVPATCFPTAVTTACSWDEDLLYKMGETMAEECLAEKVSVILGPGVNIKRSPLCGRNFEYFSEDPLLAGKMAAALIRGIQSKNVGASLKHFAANSQEKKRMTIDSIVDERALRETYLTAFEIAVKEAQPWTVMNSYNKVNGVYASDNGYLQNTILRNEWGFEGLVVSDWGAANDRVTGMINGNDLEMPSSGGYNDAKVCKAVREGRMKIDSVDTCADRVLDLILKSKESLSSHTYDKKEHHKIAAEICKNSLVLLKNEDNMLPLKKDKTIAVIGEMARCPRYQGAGSSNINPTQLDDAFDALLEKGYKVNFAPGYNKKKDAVNEIMLKDACIVAERADNVLLFIGLTEEYESEGYDRTHLNLPSSHVKLLEEILKVNENVTVVLYGGSPVVIPQLDKIKALVNGYLGGQAGGSALVEILSGDFNPCGKLAETYPLSLEDTPCNRFYPATGTTAEHRESIFVGYRYYDSAKKNVLFPFGYGLSYTDYKYSGLKLSKKKIKDTEELTVTFKIKNTGKIAGAEIAQLYVKDKESTVYRPEKELRGFKKIFLEPGEEKTVEITLSKRAFAYYNINIGEWHVESGDFDILIGASSRNIKLEATVTVESTVEAEIPDYRKTAACYYEGRANEATAEEFEAILGRKLPSSTLDKNAPLTMLNSLGDAVNTKWGKVINNLLDKALSSVSGEDQAMGMAKAMALEIPIRNFVTMSAGVFSEEMANGLLMILNGEKPAYGLGKILAGLLGAIRKLPDLLKAI